MNNIKSSWDKVNPTQTTEIHILNTLFDRTCSLRHKNRNNIVKKAIPVAACLAIMLITALILANFNSSIGSDSYIRGLPVNNFNLAELINDDNTNRIVFSDFDDIFEYSDFIILVKVMDIKQWEDTENLAPTTTLEIFRQASTVQIIDVAWNHADEYPSLISVTQGKVLNNICEDDKINLLRQGGVYLLPVKQCIYDHGGGDWCVIGDSDVLFEVDDEGKVWSHSGFETFSQYNGKNIEDFLKELKTIAR